MTTVINPSSGGGTAPFLNDNITNGNNLTVPANKNLYIADYLEISNGDTVEIADTGVLEIG